MTGGGKDISTSPLTKEDLVRYSRQILFPAFGEEGQRKLRKAHVLIAGVGGLGSPCAIYLSCAGIGKLTLVDSDAVELSNLNRQILHGEEDIGEKKVISFSPKPSSFLFVTSPMHFFPITELASTVQVERLSLNPMA